MLLHNIMQLYELKALCPIPQDKHKQVDVCMSTERSYGVHAWQEYSELDGVIVHFVLAYRSTVNLKR